MKVSDSIIRKYSFLFLSTFCLGFSCKSNAGQNAEVSHKPDTLYVPRTDTIVVFDPETNIETVKIVKSTDTVIHK